MNQNENTIDKIDQLREQIARIKEDVAVIKEKQKKYDDDNKEIKKEIQKIEETVTSISSSLAALTMSMNTHNELHSKSDKQKIRTIDVLIAVGMLTLTALQIVILIY